MKVKFEMLCVAVESSCSLLLSSVWAALSFVRLLYYVPVFVVLQTQDQRTRHKMSQAEATRLRDELKRSQEALMELSAWDEEKVELEMEV